MNPVDWTAWRKRLMALSIELIGDARALLMCVCSGHHDAETGAR
jgi:hypothetical protein